jgi:hypothetical protein
LSGNWAALEGIAETRSRGGRGYLCSDLLERQHSRKGVPHEWGMGIGRSVARPCADREFALDLASHLDRAVGIVVGTIAQLIIGAAVGAAVLGTDESWVKFLSGLGAIVLTFLAGAELDPQVFRLKWKEAASVGAGKLLLPLFGVHGLEKLRERSDRG